MMGGAADLDLGAFKGMMTKLKPETNLETAMEAFNVFASDVNTLSCDQFVEKMSNMGVKEDGKISGPLTKEQAQAFVGPGSIEEDGKISGPLTKEQ